MHDEPRAERRQIDFFDIQILFSLEKHASHPPSSLSELFKMSRTIMLNHLRHILPIVTADESCLTFELHQSAK
jgi:hypothetical protein